MGDYADPICEEGRREDAGALAHVWNSLFPPHWTATARRESRNALLNYSYSILETEGTIALHAIGLDPGMGVLHADQRNRASLTLDVIEPVRPKVDALVLELMRTRVFSMRDFFETREGNCRLMPGITKALSEQTPTMARWVAPVVERLASVLFQSESNFAKRDVRLPTRLAEDNRSAGRDGVRTEGRKATKDGAAVPSACKGCGVILETRGLIYCPDCLKEFKPEQDRANIAAGTAKLADLRLAGEDPAHGSEAKCKRGETLRENARLSREWEAQNPSVMTEEDYRKRVLPALATVPSRAIMAAMDVSQAYALAVRNGKRLPHPRHWEALRSLSNAHDQQQAARGTVRGLLQSAR